MPVVQSPHHLSHSSSLWSFLHQETDDSSQRHLPWRKWFLTQVDFAPNRIFSNLWRRFCLSQSGDRVLLVSKRYRTGMLLTSYNAQVSTPTKNYSARNVNTVMYPLIIGIRSENYIIRQFLYCVNIINALTQTGVLLPTIHLGYMAKPIAPRLLTCTTGYWTTGHNIESRTGENDAFNRCRKHKMSEATASITGHTVVQHTFIFINRKSTL